MAQCPVRRGLTAYRSSQLTATSAPRDAAPSCVEAHSLPSTTADGHVSPLTQCPVGRRPLSLRSPPLAATLAPLTQCLVAAADGQVKLLAQCLFAKGPSLLPITADGHVSPRRS